MNHNAEAVIMVMRPPETTVQLVINAVNGVGSMPGVGSMSPRLIPAELSGMALCNFFDARGIPTRNSVPVYLPGNTSIGISQSPLQGPPRVSAPPKLPAATQPAAAPSPTVTISHPFQAQAAPSKPSVQAPAPAPDTSTEEDEEETTDPNLARELALAKVSQIRSETLQHEEKAGMEIERERLVVTKASTHTREVAEAFQLNSMMRRELLAAQGAYREGSLQMMQTVDVASRRVLEMADMVAERLKDPRFAPMPQPPPPPPDYVALFGNIAQRALDIYMSAQRKARKRRRHRSFEWDQLEDLATELLKAKQVQQAQPPPAQSAALNDDDDDDDENDDDEGDEDDNAVLLRRILSSKTQAESEAENKTAPPPLDPKANRELDEFLKSETALDLLAKLTAKKDRKPSP